MKGVGTVTDGFTQTKYGYLNLTKLMFSGVVLLYFVAVIAVNQVKSIVASGFFYLVLLLGTVVYFYTKRSMAFRPVIFYAIGAAILGACNILFVGNLTWLRVVILFVSFLFAVIFLDDDVDERTFLIAVYLNAAVVAFRLFLYGRQNPVYVDSSNNYISVHLLMPAVLYYSMLEMRGKKIPIFPAVVIWILSLLAGGRGGLLAATILLGGIILYRFYQDEVTRRERAILGIILFVIMVPVVLIVLQFFVSKFSGLYVVTRFLDKGMDGGGRLACWTEYIEKSSLSLSRFLFGTDLTKVDWAVHYNGNLHNSYLFVHAYLGIFGFLFVIVMLIRAVVLGIRCRKWIYVTSLITIMFRSLTDHVFGVNRLSVVILALIFIPDILRIREKSQKRILNGMKENDHADTCSDPGQSRV